MACKRALDLGQRWENLVEKQHSEWFQSGLPSSKLTLNYGKSQFFIEKSSN